MFDEDPTAQCNYFYALLSVAHLSIANRLYRDALPSYLNLLQMAPNDPIILLCLGVSFLLRSVQNRCENRNYTILTVITPNPSPWSILRNLGTLLGRIPLLIIT